MASENDTPESHYGQSLAAAARARRAEEIRNVNTAIDAAQVEAQTGATPRAESHERAALRELVEAVKFQNTKTVLLLSSHVCADHGLGDCGDRANLNMALRWTALRLARAEAALKGVGE